MQTPEFIPGEPPEDAPGVYDEDDYVEPAGILPALGERLTWVSGLVLAISAFTGWYTGSGEGLKIAVLGWDTGTLGKLVFLVGFALVVLVLAREAGIELPPAVPEALVVAALGALATIFVLIRVITVPDDLLPADGRGIGLWISLAAALLAVAAGIVERRKSSEHPPADRGAERRAGDDVERVVHADVDPRERDRGREAEEDGASRGKNRLSIVAPAKLVAAWPDGNDQSVGTRTSGSRCGRRRSTSDLTASARTSASTTARRPSARPAGRRRRDGEHAREHDPDEAAGADPRQRDEQPVQPLDPMVDDPDREVTVDRQSRPSAREQLLRALDQLLRVERLADEALRAARSPRRPRRPCR